MVLKICQPNNCVFINFVQQLPEPQTRSVLVLWECKHRERLDILSQSELRQERMVVRLPHAGTRRRPAIARVTTTTISTTLVIRL